MTDLAWIFAALAALASSAWFAEHVHGLRRQYLFDSLADDYSYVVEENEAHKRLLAEAIAALPEPRKGRTIEPIRYEAWPERHKQRLQRHLDLVDERPSA